MHSNENSTFKLKGQKNKVFGSVASDIKNLNLVSGTTSVLSPLITPIPDMGAVELRNGVSQAASIRGAGQAAGSKQAAEV